MRDTLPFAAYGQGQVLATPFKMARVAATIAGDGAMPQGRWVIDETNRRTDAPRAVLSPAQARNLAGIMRRAVVEGTGRSVKDVEPAIAGKTGTAEVQDAPVACVVRGIRAVRRRPAAAASPAEPPASAGQEAGAVTRIAFAVLVEHGGYGGVGRRADRGRGRHRGPGAEDHPIGHTMGILDNVRKIEKRIERLAERTDIPPQPIEIRKAALDEIEDLVEPSGRTRRVFPYNHVTVEVVVPQAGQRAAMEAVLGEEGDLAAAVAERLRAAGCAAPRDLDVRLKIVRRPGSEWETGRLFRVMCERKPPADARSAGVRDSGDARPATLAVIKGDATHKSYGVKSERTNIGRLAEVLDRDKRVVRRNQVVFTDRDNGINQTVSRAHAHILRTPTPASSACSTTTVRAAPGCSAAAGRSPCRRAVRAARACSPATRSTSGRPAFASTSPRGDSTIWSNRPTVRSRIGPARLRIATPVCPINP